AALGLVVGVGDVVAGHRPFTRQLIFARHDMLSFDAAADSKSRAAEAKPRKLTHCRDVIQRTNRRNDHPGAELTVKRRSEVGSENAEVGNAKPGRRKSPHHFPPRTSDFRKRSFPKEIQLPPSALPTSNFRLPLAAVP